jgi:hypothetical protein
MNARLRNSVATIAIGCLVVWAASSADAQNRVRKNPGALDQGQQGLGDQTQEQQLKMQMMMDRKAKANQTLSNTMKKHSDTQQGTTQNMK